MDKFYLTENIAIELIPVSHPFSDTNFLFGCDDSVVVAGEIIKRIDATLASVVDDSIGSEHWITESSDFFRFYDSGQLHSLLLSVPSETAPFDAIIPQARHGYFSANLANLNNKGFVVPQQRYRIFDSQRRMLLCFNENTLPDSIFEITADLSLIFNKDGMLSGWVMERPLENLTASLQGRKDPDVANDDTYTIFSDCMEIFNDTEILAIDAEDDVETVAKRLIDDMNSQKTARIKGTIRREVLEKSLRDVKDRFL